MVGTSLATRFVKLWECLRLIAEPSHTMGETAFYEAKDKIAIGAENVAEPASAERSSLAKMSFQLAQQVDEPYGYAPLTLTIVPLSQAKSTYSNRSDEAGTSSQMVTQPDIVDEDTEYEEVESSADQGTTNMFAMRGCSYIGTCTGRDKPNNRLHCCKVCSAKSTIGEHSTCCTQCTITKFLQLSTSDGLSVADLNAAAMCLNCWRATRPTQDVVAHTPMRYGIKSGKYDANAFVSSWKKHAVIWQEFSNKECKKYDLTMEGDAFIDAKNEMDDLKKRAAQLMMCLEMQYYDGFVTTAAEEVVAEWRLLFQVPEQKMEVPAVPEPESAGEIEDAAEFLCNDNMTPVTLKLALRKERLVQYEKAALQLCNETGPLGPSVTLVHDTWQSFWAKVQQNQILDQDTKLSPNSFNVIHIDPMYAASEQVQL